MGNNKLDPSFKFCVGTGGLTVLFLSFLKRSTFHKNSAEIIRTAVFGKDPETGDTREFLHFPANNLYITSVDIREVEPVDARTRDALQRSVQIAIETATQASEQAAKMSAERTEQGLLSCSCLVVAQTSCLCTRSPNPPPPPIFSPQRLAP